MAKGISDKAIALLEDGLTEGVKHLRAFLAYEGDNPKYYAKAKIGSVLVVGYVKAIATQTNRMAIEHAIKESEAKRLPDRTMRDPS